MEPSHPWASGIVITGNKITDVLDNAEDADAYIGANTRVVDLKGKFVVPGFIDGHVHFSGAGALINDANLMTVFDDEGLRAEMERVVSILDDGEWITGGLWGAYEEWALGAAEAGAKKKQRWEPDRWTIDEITDKNPCLLYSYDRELFLANTAALKAAGLENARLEGMKLDGKGRPTGLIYRGSEALEKIRSVV
ncbi:MAG: amidohydrolase family protein, partial [Acidobacteriota bacterium]